MKDSERTILYYEILGMVFIIILGSLLHFTFEWSNYNSLVGIFSAVNESVWEHLKIGFWPTMLFAIIEYWFLKKYSNNFWLGKAVCVCVIPVFIAAAFYSYTTFLEESLLIDISIFMIAIVIGQLVSYKLLTYRKLSEKFTNISLIVLAVWGLAFAVFTFYPPHIPLFQDAVTGSYGMIIHSH